MKSYPSLDSMTKITTELLLADFEAIIDRVIAGEYFHIKDSADRPGYVMMPYTDYLERTGPDAASLAVD